jgi:hypothetical protein
MTTLGFVLIPHDVPPVAVARRPAPSKTRDYLPVVEFSATTAAVQKFATLVADEDELGPCLVAFFDVYGTSVYLYRSEEHPPRSWLIFADVTSCVAKEQMPTKLGESVLRSLSTGKISAGWTNSEADTVYRSRRRSRGRPGAAPAKKKTSKSLVEPPVRRPAKPAQKRRTRIALPEFATQTNPVVAGGARSERPLVKAAPAKKAAKKHAG